MFDSISGSFDSFDSEGVTDSSLDLIAGSLRDWVITIDDEEYEITGNTTSKILFTNEISEVGDYTIDFVTKSLMVKFESEISDVTKFPVSLISSKIINTKKHFLNKIESNFNNLYLDYSDDINPLNLIANLYKVQLPFIYYCLAEIYGDVMYSRDDINNYKVDKYMSKYRDLIKDSIANLRIDLDNDKVITNEEKAKDSGGDKNILTR